MKYLQIKFEKTSTHWASIEGGKLRQIHDRGALLERYADGSYKDLALRAINDDDQVNCEEGRYSKGEGVRAKSVACQLDYLRIVQGPLDENLRIPYLSYRGSVVTLPGPPPQGFQTLHRSFVGELDLVSFLFLHHGIRQPPMKSGATRSLCMVQPMKMPSRRTEAEAMPQVWVTIGLRCVCLNTIATHRLNFPCWLITCF